MPPVRRFTGVTSSQWILAFTPIYDTTIPVAAYFHEFSVPIRYWQIKLKPDLRGYIACDEAMSHCYFILPDDSCTLNLRRRILDAGKIGMCQSLALIGDTGGLTLRQRQSRNTRCDRQ